MCGGVVPITNHLLKQNSQLTLELLTRNEHFKYI